MTKQNEFVSLKSNTEKFHSLFLITRCPAVPFYALPLMRFISLWTFFHRQPSNGLPCNIYRSLTRRLKASESQGIKVVRVAKSQKRHIASKTFSFYSIFGEAKDTNSGVYDAEQSDKEILVSYHFYLEELSDFDKEIGIELAPKIKEFYKKVKEADRVAFKIYVPRMAEFPWKPYVFFVVTRKLIEETDWTKLLDTEFLEAVIDVKYYE